MKNHLLLLKVFAGAFLLSNTLNAQYCIPTYDSNCIYGDGINNFILTGSGIEHYGSGCSTDGNGDFSATPGLYGTLQASVEYDLTITHDYLSQLYATIWIEFNNDFTFDDVTEIVYQSVAGSEDGLTE